MIHRCVTEGRKTGTIILLVLINAILFGRLTWCAVLDEPRLFKEHDSSHFDSLENPFSDETYNIKTLSCIIPSVNFPTYSRNILSESQKRLQVCSNYNTRLVESNQTHIWIVQNNYKYYKINNESNLVCCYKSFYQPHQSRRHNRIVIANKIQYHDCIYFDNFIVVNDEFVKVTCYFSDRNVYEQYFIFTPKKALSFVRDNPFNVSAYQHRYDVLILGIGSMSRRKFHRAMRRTVQLLKKYKAVELKGYSSVAADTFQNMMAVLVGKNNLELKATCLSNSRSTLDSCPFIWDRFKDVGYNTALVEDTSRFSMFNRGKSSFKDKPTDYYVHPFIHETETLNREKHKKSIAKCMGDKYYLEVLLDYIHDLTTNLKHVKLFGVFWEKSMRHHNFNDPINMDSAYVRLFKNMRATGYLNNAILVLLSDHGIDIRDIEERRQPFAFILLPPSFMKQYKLAYKNLKWNVGRLTTPFDLHQTLLDLVKMTDLSKKILIKRSMDSYALDRGISLFLKVPQNRTCEVAAINSTWCPCYSDVIISTTNPKLEDAVKFITYQTNEILRPYPECVKLTVQEVITAKEMMPLYGKNNEWRMYNVIIRTGPGGWIFDIILRYYNKDWSIVDHMERLNSVDFRSSCVKDPLIKTFCYCK